jgi:hypothetical protein
LPDELRVACNPSSQDATEHVNAVLVDGVGADHGDSRAGLGVLVTAMTNPGHQSTGAGRRCLPGLARGLFEHLLSEHGCGACPCSGDGVHHLASNSGVGESGNSLEFHEE